MRRRRMRRRGEDGGGGGRGGGGGAGEVRKLKKVEQKPHVFPFRLVCHYILFMDNFYSFFAETTPSNHKFTTVFNSFSTTLIFIISL